MLSYLYLLFSRFYHFLAFLYSQFFITLPYPTIRWHEKTVIVTGASSGLGLEAARHFVRLGAKKVILAVRDIEKGDRAKASIQASTGREEVAEVWHLDLASRRSVRAFADRVKEHLDRVDAIIENAAVATPRFRIIEGSETTITINVVGTILLALLLLPKMRETAERYNTHPHLSVVSSEVIFHTDFPERNAPAIFDMLDKKDLARMVDRYNVSKLIVSMVCREFAAIHHDNHPVIINFLNPGLCHSELLREISLPAYFVKMLLARSAEEGSRTLVHAASAGSASHGQYLSDCKIKDPPTFLLTKEGAETQERIWTELVTRLLRIEPGIRANL